MNPSVRSRLVAAAAAFLLGFGVANYGILMIPRPDQWLWLGFAAVLMLTAGAGVMFADTRRPVSFWGILGVELFVVFTLAPLLWLFTLATTPPGAEALTLWPREVSWEVFSATFEGGDLRRALVNSLVPAALATVVAIVVGLGAAYTFVRTSAPGRRGVYGLVVAVLLAPLLTLAVPASDQALALEVADSRWTMSVAYLAITVPLAIWLLVTVFAEARWDIVEAARADGALRRDVLRRIVVPALLPGVLVTTIIVFVIACQDFVIGAALSATDDSRPLPATLLVVAGGPEGSTSTVAAAGLLWLLPVALVLGVLPGRIVRLLGRSYR